MNDKITILVVEDDIMTLETIIENLTDRGFDVIAAENGIEALKILESTTKQIKVIILDWMMPEMNGIELLGLLKEDEGYRRIPVIMQTAKTDSEHIIKGIDQGAYQYLTKPFDDEVLYSMVRSAVAEYDRFQAIKENANQQVKDMRSSIFRERIRWKTP
ncbi:response regulator [bacterium]|nr:response regulator [bacterium]